MEEKCGLGTKVEQNTAESDFHHGEERFGDRERTLFLTEYVCAQ